MTRYRTLVDLYDDGTLAITMAVAFAAEAQSYGVRLEGIEMDINEWNDFFLGVARRMLDVPSASKDTTG